MLLKKVSVKKDRETITNARAIIMTYAYRCTCISFAH